MKEGGGWARVKEDVTTEVGVGMMKPRDREEGKPLEAKKIKGQIPSYSLRTQSCQHLGFSPLKPILDF